MTDNPFQPPNSELEDAAKVSKPGSLWLGILIGAVVDYGGTMLFGVVAGVAYMMQHFTPGMSPADIEKLAAELQQQALDINSIWGMAGIIMGSGFSILGGFVCALIAKERWHKAVLILAALMMAYGLVLGLRYSPALRVISLSLLTFASIYFGGWLRGRSYMRG